MSGYERAPVRHHQARPRRRPLPAVRHRERRRRPLPHVPGARHPQGPEHPRVRRPARGAGGMAAPPLSPATRHASLFRPVCLRKRGTPANRAASPDATVAAARLTSQSRTPDRARAPRRTPGPRPIFRFLPVKRLLGRPAGRSTSRSRPSCASRAAPRGVALAVGKPRSQDLQRGRHGRESPRALPRPAPRSPRARGEARARPARGGSRGLPAGPGAAARRSPQRPADAAAHLPYARECRDPREARAAPRAHGRRSIPEVSRSMGGVDYHGAPRRVDPPVIEDLMATPATSRDTTDRGAGHEEVVRGARRTAFTADPWRYRSHENALTPSPVRASPPPGTSRHHPFENSVPISDRGVTRSRYYPWQGRTTSPRGVERGPRGAPTTPQ